MAVSDVTFDPDRRCARCGVVLDPDGEIHALSAHQIIELGEPGWTDTDEFHEDCCPFCELPGPVAEAILTVEGKLDGTPPAR